LKRILVALTAFTVTSAVYAQSSVTLFGVVDSGVSYYQNESKDAFGNIARTSRTALSDNGTTTSRLGFRGTEDLGGGLSANFWLEAAIFADDGTVGANVANVGPAVNGFFSRRATVSLAGAFGEVRLGRDFTPTNWNDSVFDPFTNVGSGASLIATANGFSSSGAAVNGFQANNMYVRASNTVGYFLPPGLGGFYGQVMHAFNEQTKYDPGILTPKTPNNSRAGAYAGGRFGYASGPLDIAVAYGEATLADSYFAGLTTSLNTFSIGSYCDFQVVKVSGEYWRAKLKTQNDGPVPIATDFATPGAKGYLLAASMPIGPGLIRMSYSEVKLDRNLQRIDGDPKANKVAFGYLYNLSKRTALYATVAQINNKNGYDLGVGGSPQFVSVGTFQARTSRGYDLGLRHVF
jgi:predicted porin